MKLIYQEHSLKPGIYRIFNTHTNRIYVGQAQCFKKRWSDHRRSLLSGKHQNRFLQADFDKCKEFLGHDDFLEFHVTEVMIGSTKEERNKKEEESIGVVWDLKLSDGSRACYNFKESSASQARSCYSITPEETRTKKSLKSKEMWADPEFKEITREAIRAGTMKPESRKLRSEAMKKVWNNPEHREKVVAHRERPELKEQFMRTCHTAEAIEKRRQSRKKFYGKVISPTGEIHEVWSLSEFCRTHELGKNARANLGKLLQGKYQQVLGWKLASHTLMSYLQIP